jgi:hypothetical protein
MALFAVLSNNVVQNVIVCDSRAVAEEITRATCIEYTKDNPAGIGMVYDHDKDTFTSPEEPKDDKK